MSLRAVLAHYRDDPIPIHGVFEQLPFVHPLDFAHLRLWEISVLFPSVMKLAEGYRSLVLVRDPYRRFVSAVDQHFKTVYPNLPLINMRPQEQTLTIETFIEQKMHLETLRTDYRFVHLSPQVWFLQLDGCRVPRDIVPMDGHGKFIVRGLESLGLPPQAVPHDNGSRFDLSHVLASPKIRAFVRDFYAEDFAFFAADPALAHLADKAATLSARQPALSPLIQNAEQRSGGVTSAQQHMDAAELIDTYAEVDGAAVDLAAGRLAQALERINIILTKYPDHARALGMLGQIAVVADKPAVGLAPLQRAVALDPRLEHRVWLSLCLAKLGCGEDAVQVIAAGVETMPPTANANFAVGMVFYALGQYDDAARFYSNCIALDATRAGAQHRYARALQASGKIEPAINAYMEAIRNVSSQADYYADLSGALSDLGRFEEAFAAASTAVELDPASIVAYNNLGHALQSLNRSSEAVGAYQKAIEVCDTYAKAQLGYALALLKCGDFERGWQRYEWRWQSGQKSPLDPGVLIWRGEALGGRTILLHAEQGLGDTLQFVRFAPLVTFDTAGFGI